MIPPMANLTEKQRAQLPDSAFAYIDSTGRRRLPIHDEPHVRAALGRFGSIDFDDEAARNRARSRLLRAAKRYGIVPVGFVDGQLRPERRLPTGRVTLLMADVEGSSQLLAELGDEYPKVIAAARRIIRAAVRRSGGLEVDARADEFFAAFARAEAALEAATAIHREMAAAEWPDGRPVRVRIGLHTGRPTLTAAGYVGIAVNTVARICAAGHGGQVLVSRSTLAALADEAVVETRSLGSHRLRGIPDAQELLQLVAEGLQSEFPPLRL
jgi:class 3 adenylate cyclase